jgi:hypothetical protein
VGHSALSNFLSDFVLSQSFPDQVFHSLSPSNH